ncbi:hypothetical protein IAI10_13740 [Clostridium sp. 19966]|uniref:hypothetical protein n=1 Tax=Clostridium sp. 19966 TaxID=2768166 RepID=UPI0028DE49A7|nr:hypothetical protein [Clostridium sp. 19966]MDT8717726.1 hypothetical protein [Clostridium sp. 19966]
MNSDLKLKNENTYLLFTIPIVILVVICSSIGIWHERIYSKETLDWLSQTVGQDISNLFFISPILIISAFYSSKGSKAAKIIWIGTMLTNIYSYVIYCFALHFNFLFHVYCLILGLSIYAVIYCFIKNKNVDFKEWFSEVTPTKSMGIALFVIALLFVFLWLSNSLPQALNNTVPDNIKQDGLLTNPIHVLDLSFYLPLMFIASFKVLKKEAEGYLLAPMMMVFGILTNINIICLMIVSMQKESINNLPQIVIFFILGIVCITFLLNFLKNISREPNDI